MTQSHRILRETCSVLTDENRGGETRPAEVRAERHCQDGGRECGDGVSLKYENWACASLLRADHWIEERLP